VPGLQEAFDRIGEAVERTLPLTHAPGMVVAVTDGDEILGAAVRGLADVDRATPITPHTRFQIASMSKSFAGLVAVQEAAAGRLDLHVSINEVLPWLGMPEPFGPVTLHHLMTHTAGISSGADLAPFGRADALMLREHPPVWAPGSRALYSNLGWKLVGFALEERTGLPIGRLLEERIMAPLGMRDSEGWMVDEQRTNAATPYLPLRSDRPPHLQQPLAPTQWQVSTTADGSIVSTAVDMCAYLRMILARGDPLLDATAFATWVGPHEDSEDEGERYGYGWVWAEMGGRMTLRHTGTNVGFNSLMAVWPDDGIGVVICMNGWGDRKIVGTYALDVVAAALAGTALPDVPDLPPADAIPGAEAFAGVFEGDRRTWRLRPEDDGLFLEAGPVGVRLERLEDALIAPHPVLERFPLVPVRDDAGTVVELGHGPSRYVREGTDRPAAPGDPGWSALQGAYRSTSPWTSLLRVYERGGALWLMTPAYGSEERLYPLEDGSFALDDPASPERITFDLPIAGAMQRLTWCGWSWYRSAMD
jgi:CubicO group peptidase (beta-lactamase class C family)